MNIALFGGTFDPIHSGHMWAVKAAARKFRLGRILFVPSGNPPHKYRDRLTPFAHRFAMVALACATDRRFVPSLLEAPRPDGQPHFSIDTARTVRRSLSPDDLLFFLLGADAFLDLPHWKDYRRLLETANFVIVSRPGFSNEEIRKIVPSDLLRSNAKAGLIDKVELKHTTVHVLRGVDVPVASRDIRQAIQAGDRVTGLVPRVVEQYIVKEGLYRPARTGSTQ